MTLEVRDLVAGYTGSPVLHGVGFDCRPGECVAILGANGAGKTTLLKTVSGLLPARGGAVTFAGADITNRAAFRIARGGLVHVAEGRRLFPAMTVEGNLRLAEKFAARRGPSRITAMLERWPVLGEKRHQLAGTLSGGQQQLLVIGQAMLASPAIVMLDEPTAGLSPIMIDAVRDAVAGLLDEGVGVVLVEQSVELSSEVCTRFLVMSRGRVAYRGEAADLRDTERLAAAYMRD
jgi:branched-chain amino acid transport system ATP-binding protein